MDEILRRQATQPDGDGAALGGVGPLRPLRVSGLIVSSQALVEALRCFIPGLKSIQATEDGDYYCLMLEEGEGDENPSAEDR